MKRILILALAGVLVLSVMWVYRHDIRFFFPTQWTLISARFNPDRPPLLVIGDSHPDMALFPTLETRFSVIRLVRSGEVTQFWVRWIPSFFSYPDSATVLLWVGTNNVIHRHQIPPFKKLELAVQETIHPSAILWMNILPVRDSLTGGWKHESLIDSANHRLNQLGKTIPADSLIRTHPHFLSSDGIHLTRAGYLALDSLINRRLP